MRTQGKSGFLVVEILCTLVIVGVIVAVITPSYWEFKEDAKQKASLMKYK